MCLLPAANAEVPTEKTQNQQIESASVNKVAPATIEQAEEETVVSEGQLVIIDSKQTKTIDINGNNNISLIAEEYGLKLENYRTTEGEAVDPEYKLSDKEKLLLFKSEMSATSELIELQIPTLEEESSDLYIGEKEVKSEGKVGQALKTTITAKDLSADKKLNVDAEQQKTPSVSDKLTVLTAPEAKIVLVGTKEKPAPVVEEVETLTQIEDNISPNEENSTPDTHTSASEVNTRATKADPSKLKPYTETDKQQIQNIAAADNPDGQKAVEIAMTRLGSPYVWGATGPNQFDCSGLVYWVYSNNLGREMPRTASTIGPHSTPVPMSEIQPGDVLWTNSHIGIYIGDGKMVHASGSKKEVMVADIQWFLNDGAKAGRL